MNLSEGSSVNDLEILQNIPPEISGVINSLWVDDQTLLKAYLAELLTANAKYKLFTETVLMGMEEIKKSSKVALTEVIS